MARPLGRARQPRHAFLLDLALYVLKMFQMHLPEKIG